MPVTTSTILPTDYGDFKTSFHKSSDNSGSGVSLSMGDLTLSGTLVRVHSSCLFTETFHSRLCDCELQLSKSMELIKKEGSGLIVYTYEEGRGIGLENKIAALELERTENVDTVQAFIKLGFEPDPRDYKIAEMIISDLNVNKDIRLITNNPHKKDKLESIGFNIIERVSLDYPLSERLKKYLRVKKEKLGHIIDSSLLE